MSSFHPNFSGLSRLFFLALLAMWGFPACELMDGADGDTAPINDATSSADSPADGVESCTADGVCDPTCTSDPDCACDCDVNSNVCDVESSSSDLPCECDGDCENTTPCGNDLFCDVSCFDDPDCTGTCDCDRSSEVCNAAAVNSSDDCACDPECDGTRYACDDDTICDSWCPAGVDLQCDCSCDWNAGICDSGDGNAPIACSCDADCDGGGEACTTDGVCDDKCASGGGDPDCDCLCAMTVGICDAADDGTTDVCDCDADCLNAFACEPDNYCDAACPENTDRDCCDCDYYVDVCEAAADGSEVACACDLDCTIFVPSPCTSDSHCDTWCDPGGVCSDPDCTGVGTAVCARP